MSPPNRALEQVAAARAELVAAQARFDEAIRAAHQAGMPYRAIAAPAELSHQRVHQIVAATPDASTGASAALGPPTRPTTPR